MVTNYKHKSPSTFVCETCDYNTSNKKDYAKHISTPKHIKMTTMVTYDDNKSSLMVCVCGNTYKYRQGLSRHKKSCSSLINKDIIDTIQPNQQLEQQPKVSTEDMQMTLILELVKQNQEFKNLLIQQSNQMMEQSNQMMEQNKTMIEVAKNSQGNNTINQMNNSNNNNKTFNLQFFLNETCKDAMNMKDFIQSLEMSFTELEKMGEIGFAEGMSRLFVDRLNKLDITKRPIHCSDVKREIIHIKDDNKWERDNANLDRLRKIIKQLTHKNILRVDDWKQANKGCTEYNSRKNALYLNMNIQAIGPVDDEEVKREFGKIIRRVAETTAIDKKYICI